MPSRLYGAFPDGVEVRRVGLAEAVRETRAFLSAHPVRTEELDAGSAEGPEEGAA
jgi:ATP-dependent DNA helicase DinG